jgi:hypothetical protein
MDEREADATTTARSNAEGPTEEGAPAQDGEPSGDDASLLFVLTAEHASLVSARSLAYNEAFTRAGSFLQALGMSFVGLSLLGAALGFGRELLGLAAIVLAFDVVIGAVTFLRVAGTGAEDLQWMQAMNRIRRGYIEIAPRARRYLTSGTYDDVNSVLRSYGFTGSRSVGGDVAYGLSTSLGLVGLLLASTVGVLASLLVLLAGGPGAVAVAAGIVVGVVAMLVEVRWVLGAVGRHQASLEVRYGAPDGEADDG